MTASTERPIIFGAPSIRAILDGRKSQTRRVLSTRNTRRDGHPWSKRYPWEAHDWASAFVDDGPSPAGNPGPYLKAPCPAQETRHRIYPIYWPGDRFWVRETWATVNTYSGPGWVYRADGAFIQPEYDGPDEGIGPSFNYEKYPGCYTMWISDLMGGAPGHSWSSSIHMPRWASRITLEVTDVRIERLHDISEEDAFAEGIEPFGDSAAFVKLDYRLVYGTARGCFKALWWSIHGPDAWEANPWVAAITFKRLKAGSR